MRKEYLNALALPAHASLLRDSEGLFKVPRPHKKPILLDLEGDQLMIDEQIALSYEIDTTADRMRLFISRPKNSPVTVIRVDGEERTYILSHSRRTEASFTKIGIDFSRNHPLIYVGRNYRLVFGRFLLGRNRLEFNLSSVVRIEDNPFKAGIDSTYVLEKLNKEA